LLPAVPTATEQGVAAGAAVTARQSGPRWATPRDNVLKLSRAVSEKRQAARRGRKNHEPVHWCPEVSTPEEFMRDSENDIRFLRRIRQAAEG